MNLDSLARVLRRHLERLVRLVARAERGDVRGVHDARVTSRRLREALPIAGAIVPGDAGAIRRDVRRLTRALGDVRELDVAYGILDEQVRGRPWPGAVVAKLRQHLSDERDRRARRMRARTARVGVDRVATRIEALADAMATPVRPARGHELLALRLRERARRLGQALRGAGTLYVPQSLHAVRVAGKKLRYSLELARDVARVPAARDLRTLRVVQDLLGRMHDLQILQEHVHLVAAEAAPDRTVTRALEEIAASLEAECRELQAKFLRQAPTLLVLSGRVADEASARRARKPVKQMIAMGLAGGAKTGPMGASSTGTAGPIGVTGATSSRGVKPA